MKVRSQHATKAGTQAMFTFTATSMAYLIGPRVFLRQAVPTIERRTSERVEEALALAPGASRG